MDLNAGIISNIGNAGTDFTATGGLTLAGDLKLSNNQILNSAGTATIILNQTPGDSTPSKNILNAGNWMVQNTSAAGINKAALIVDQQMSEDLFTASASAATKFVIDNSGNIKSVAGADWRPLTDATNALNIAKADGTDFVTFDTTNSRVGIGTTVPLEKLDVRGNASVSGNLTLAGGSRTIAATEMNNLTIGDSATQNLILNPGGNIGVGVTSPTTFKLELTGNFGPNAAPTYTAISQTATTLDSTNSVGQYTSIAIGRDGLPVISFYDSTNSALRFCKCTAADCSTSSCSAIESTNDVGKYSAIAIGTNGNPIISHFDDTNNQLRVCACADAACASSTCTALDTSITSGGWTDIAIGWDSLPVVVHTDAANYDSRVCQCNNTTCTAATCSIGWNGWTTGDGEGNSSAIGVEGLPIVSTHSHTNGDLYTYKCLAANCSSVSAAVSTYAGTHSGNYTSIAIAPDGLPIISHYDGSSTQDLIVTKCSNSYCAGGAAYQTSTTIDSTSNVGTWTSIAIGNDGLPIISYEAVNTSLKVAKCRTSTCS